VLSPMAAPSGFVRRLKSIAWRLFLVAAVVLCGILALQAPATEQARQALSSWSLLGLPGQQLPEVAQRWSKPKPDAATHCLLADLYGRSVVASWPVCDKSEFPLSVDACVGRCVYMASAPSLLRSCGLNSVALGFVDVFWILGEKDVLLRASRPAPWVSARHYGRCGGSEADADTAG